MQETLRRIQARRAAGDQGFTLIELLVVVVIIGVLVGISIPVYLNYTNGAKNKSAESDVRGAVGTVEAFYTENNVYPDTVTGTVSTNIDLTNSTAATNSKITVSSGNQLAFKNNTSSYVVCGLSAPGKIYVYNSSAGGSVKESTQTSLAACVTSGN